MKHNNRYVANRRIDGAFWPTSHMPEWKQALKGQQATRANPTAAARASNRAAQAMQLDLSGLEALVSASQDCPRLLVAPSEVGLLTAMGKSSQADSEKIVCWIRHFMTSTHCMYSHLFHGYSFSPEWVLRSGESSDEGD